MKISNDKINTTPLTDVAPGVLIKHDGGFYMRLSEKAAESVKLVSMDSGIIHTLHKDTEVIVYPRAVVMV